MPVPHTPRGMGVPPMGHGQDARATLLRATPGGEGADDDAGQDQAGDGRYKRNTARRMAGGCGRFTRIDHGERVDAARFQRLAHRLAERADGGREEIGHLKACGVEFVAGPHAAYERDAGGVCADCEFNFGRDGIDGIDHIVKVSEVKGVGVFRQIESVTRINLDSGRDVADACRHHFGLGAAQRAVQRDKLAVEIGGCDDIAIHQHEVADTGARQRFGGEGADATETEKRDTAGAETLNGVTPQQLFGARMHRRSPRALLYLLFQQRALLGSESFLLLAALDFAGGGLTGETLELFTHPRLGLLLGLSFLHGTFT